MAKRSMCVAAKDKDGGLVHATALADLLDHYVAADPATIGNYIVDSADITVLAKGMRAYVDMLRLAATVQVSARATVFSDTMAYLEKIGAKLDIDIRERVAIVVLSGGEELKFPYEPGGHLPGGKLWDDIMKGLR